MSSQNEIGNVVRARAPLRLGFAGGGTDLSPYCDNYGGAILNLTIKRYAYTTIEPRDDGMVQFNANDVGKSETLESATALPTDEGLTLHRALYNRIVQDHNGGVPLSMTLTTSVECPMGAGLGASSALVVSMIGAYRTWLSLALGDFDIAHLAYEVERIDLGMKGGRQDQYAATFGGVNFMEFAPGDKVIVNPLHLDPHVVHELESSLLLCFTGTSRVSSDIIGNQIEAMKTPASRSLEALHQLRRDALEVKAALLRAELHLLPEIMQRSWLAKKATAPGVSNKQIDTFYEAAIESGALAGKISGAGGGGFMMLLVDPLRRESVQQRLEGLGATVTSCSFSAEGIFGWRIPAASNKGNGI